MRFLATVALAAALSAPAFCGDTVITKSKHTDAAKMAGREQPAKDSTEVTWFGKDRMRIEEGDTVTLIRADQKKMYILDTKAKTSSAIDLPFDLKKFVPPDQAPMIEQFMSQMKATVTPSTETKKIKDWNATKYTLALTLPMGSSMTQDIWATKDIKFDQAAFNDLYGAMMSTSMGGGALVTEFKKIEGVAVLVERTQTMMGQTVKSREEVTSVEVKDAPEGTYEIPKDFTDTPFDPMAQGGMGGRGRGGKPPTPPPSDKPVDKPTDKPKGGNALMRQD
jgi:hypothetical protein